MITWVNDDDSDLAGYLENDVHSDYLEDVDFDDYLEDDDLVDYFEYYDLVDYLEYAYIYDYLDDDALKDDYLENSLNAITMANLSRTMINNCLCVLRM